MMHSIELKFHIIGHHHTPYIEFSASGRSESFQEYVYKKIYTLQLMKKKTFETNFINVEVFKIEQK